MQPHKTIPILLLMLLHLGLHAQAWQSRVPLPPRLSYPGSASGAADQDQPSHCYWLTWDAFNNAWDSVNVHTFTYHPSGEVFVETKANYNGSAYVNAVRHTFHKDILGRDSLTFIESWIMNAWTPVAKMPLWYDMQGNITLAYNLQWNQSAWDTSSGHQLNYIYHSSGQVQEVVTSFYDPMTQGWEPLDRFEYTFNPLDQWITETVSTFGASGWAPLTRCLDLAWHSYPDAYNSMRYQTADSSGWVDVYRYHATHAPLALNLELEFWTGFAWVPAFLDRYRWNSQGHLTTMNGAYWDDNAQSWVTTSTDSAQYSYLPGGAVAEETRMHSDNGGPYLNSDRRVCADFLSTMVPDRADFPIHTFPNPSAGALNFDLGQEPRGPVIITIFDMGGRLRMSSFATHNGAPIPVEVGLESGTYLYQAQTAEGTTTGKFSVAR